VDTDRVSDLLKPLLASDEVRAMMDSVKDYAIFLLDQSGQVLTWNAGAERIKGYKASEIVGNSFEVFYPESDRLAGRPKDFLARAARDGRAELEGWRVRKDGTLFWADAVVSAIRDRNGSLQGFVKVTRDLTERRNAEEALRLSEERLRLMIQSVEDYAIFLLDPDGRVASWNAGAQRLKGYEASEIIGSHFSRFYPPEEIETGKAERELDTARSTGRFEEEGWRVRKDGSRFWANVILSAVRERDGRLIGFTKITRDMTERKRAAESLAERSRQQSSASDLGLYALQTPELDAVMFQAKETVRQTLGVGEVRILEPHAQPPPGSANATLHGLAGEAKSYGVLSVLAGRPLNENERSFLQVVANVLAAAFARARVEEQLRRAEREAVEERGRSEQAQRALHERDEFISVAAHELRTPLTALQLKLQGLERGLGGMNGKTTHRLEGAVRQTERLARLVDRLLDVSRISQGRLEMAHEEFDLADLVRQIAEDFREPAAQARSPLDLVLPDKAEGSWDRLRIEQVLVNVLSNAVKYGASKPIMVTLEVEGERVRIAVADRGIGISPEDAARIFNRFQRAASIRHYGGLGLGLYITRHIVEAHGGTISVQSAVGEGSTFVIDLPRFGAGAVAGHKKLPWARA
jgi:PAS domain S-box-containing protein